jgi:hypothetical protein
MKKILSFILSVVVFTGLPATTYAKKSSGLSNSGGGSHSVRGHVRKDGTYVQPHRATNQNKTQRDNWSSKPNVNPYTGSTGTKKPQK